MSNAFTFTGTIGRDAEVRQIPSGQSVLNVAVANNIGFGDKQTTMWIRVALWGKRAEGTFPSYLVKGQQVFVSGELSQREYEVDGQARTSLELNANVLDLVGKKPDNQQQPQQNNQQQTQNYQQQPAQQQPQNNQQQGNNSGQNFDDDIPFNSLNSLIKNHLI